MIRPVPSLNIERPYKISLISPEIQKIEPAIRRIGDFVVGKTIGRGTFALVKIAHNQQTNEAVAIKFISREKIRAVGVAKKIIQEVLNHEELIHPHIIRLWKTLCCPTDIIMILENAERGELFDYIISEGQLKENEARRLFQQLISAVDYLHRHLIVHRDLKPENILLTGDLNLKLADFGLSRFLEDGEFLNTSCGSPNYAAPEVISGNLYGGPGVDLWSCGIILYAMLTGTLPFCDEHLPTLFKKIQAGKFRMPQFADVRLTSLIQGLLTIDPSQRLSVAGILLNPWFLIELPKYLSAQVLGRLMTLKSESRAVEEACDMLDLNEDEVYQALSSENDEFECKEIKREVQRIARKIVDDCKHVNVGNILRVTVPITDVNDSNEISESNQLKWSLGIRSSSNPKDIMTEVFESLKGMDFEWLVITPYHLVIRPKNANDIGKVHFMVNLYTIQKLPKSYLLDFKLISPEKLEASPRSTRSSSISNPSSNSTAGRINEFRKRCFSVEHNQEQVNRKLSSIVEYRRKQSYSPLLQSPVRKFSSPDPGTSSKIDPMDVLRFVSLELVERDSFHVDESPSHSELMGFFDNCGKLIMRLINAQQKL